MGEKRNAYKTMVGKPKRRDNWEDKDIDGYKILKWLLDRIEWY
jgi:hypothetical protein